METKVNTLVELRGVSHDFTQPNGQKLRVVDGITLEIRPNEVIALLGPSGCGKSTILRILAGLITPTQGEVRRDNQRFTGLNPDVGMVFQSFALCPWMTASENILAVLQARGISPDAAEARTAEVIKLVGLGGFANAYPRELSGGMKQRIGIARAIAVDRPLLFMDEPFSQVDALTAESLRSEVLDLWAPSDRNPTSIVLVSHDIKEVAFMADRIVVLGARPGRIRTIIDNRLPRPRDYRSTPLNQLVDHIHDLIMGHEMPDIAPSFAPASQPIESLPFAMPSEIVGLIEYLAAHGGQDDLFHVASAAGREFGHIIAIVKAGEMLDFIDTPKRQVVLTPLGQAFAQAKAEERQRLWRLQLETLHLVRDVRQLISHQPTREVDDQIVLETIVVRLPHEDYERQFQTLVAWGLYGEVFVHDEKRGVLGLPEEATTGTAAT